MTSAHETPNRKLVEWAKSGTFDVERAEQLAQMFKAPWESQTVPIPSVPPAQDLPPTALQLMGSADTVAAANPPSPLLPSPSAQAVSRPPPPPAARLSSPPPAPAAVISTRPQAPIDDDIALPVTRSRHTWMKAIGAAALVLIGLSAWMALKTSKNEKPLAATHTQPATTHPAPRPSEAPPPTVKPYAQAKITVIPEDATLRVDGQEVTTPYSASFDRGSSHAFEARAEGYLPRELRLRFDEDREITVRLKPAAARRTALKRAARPARAEPRRAPPRRASKKITTKSSLKKGVGFVSESPY